MKLKKPIAKLSKKDFPYPMDHTLTVISRDNKKGKLKRTKRAKRNK